MTLLAIYRKHFAIKMVTIFFLIKMMCTSFLFCFNAAGHDFSHNIIALTFQAVVNT